MATSEENTKKRKHTVEVPKLTLEEMLARPYCYYCEKVFVDELVLVGHQRDQHFKCGTCGKRMDTANGLCVHVANVHKEKLTTLKNTLPGRESAAMEVYAMIGIPDDFAQSKKNEITTAYNAIAARYKAQNGNPMPGSQEHKEAKERAKKPKITESKEDRNARLKAHIAQKKAEKAAKAEEEAALAAQTASANDQASSGAGDAGPAVNSDAIPSAAPPLRFQENFTKPVPTAPGYNPVLGPLPGADSPPPMLKRVPHALPGYGQAAPPHYAPRQPPHGPSPPVFSQSLAGQSMTPPNFAAHTPMLPARQLPIGLAQAPSTAAPHQSSLPSSAALQQSCAQSFGTVSATGSTPRSTSRSSSVSKTEPRQNSLPKVPGLPQKPSVSITGISPEVMATLHRGAPPPANMYVPYRAASPSTFSPSISQYSTPAPNGFSSPTINSSTTAAMLSNGSGNNAANAPGLPQMGGYPHGHQEDPTQALIDSITENAQATSTKVHQERDSVFVDHHPAHAPSELKGIAVPPHSASEALPVPEKGSTPYERALSEAHAALQGRSSAEPTTVPDDRTNPVLSAETAPQLPKEDRKKSKKTKKDVKVKFVFSEKNTMSPEEKRFCKSGLANTKPREILLDPTDVESGAVTGQVEVLIA